MNSNTGYSTNCQMSYLNINYQEFIYISSSIDVRVNARHFCKEKKIKKKNENCSRNEVYFQYTPGIYLWHSVAVHDTRMEGLAWPIYKYKAITKVVVCSFCCGSRGRAWLWSIETGLLIIRDWFPVANARRGLSDYLAPRKRYCFIGRLVHALAHEGEKITGEWLESSAHETSTLTGGSSRDPVRPDLIVFLLLWIRDKNLATI